MQKYLSGYKPKILIIDDLEDNIRVLGILLQNNGYQIEAATSAKIALEQLKKIKPDLILLDIMMPEIDGYALCKILKNEENTSEIPVIFVTARNDEEALLKSFEAGGVDFISKPFNPRELIVRVKTHLDLKLSKEIISSKVQEISQINRQLSESKEEIERAYRLMHNEIISASEYVHSVLPKKIKNEIIETDWLFAPSQSLGGDSFGYHWIDEDNLAIYLLDVSGHGVAAALQSVSVLNILRFSTLPDVDFRNPSGVFTELNSVFPIQKHNYLFFTIFYAVYNKRTRILKYSGAGHPAPFLISGSNSTDLLNSQNILIGTSDNVEFVHDEIFIPSDSCLIIYSDGLLDAYTFDISKWNEKSLQLYFEKSIKSHSQIGEIKDFLIKISTHQVLKDDISILKIHFK